MTLQHYFYDILSREGDDAQSTFSVALREDCTIYDGHFPGRPVSPGVCNMQMIRELASVMAGRDLQLRSVKLCRFMAVVTPQATPRLRVEIALTPAADGLAVAASITAGEETCLTYKAELA